MTGNETSSPEAIERDIEHTQDRIGATVEKLEERLTPGAVTRSVLGDDGQEYVREGLRMMRSNPVPVAMIAIGTIWLFATSDSPLIKRASDRFSRMVGGHGDDRLRSRGEEPAPIGPPPESGAAYDRRPEMHSA